MVQRVFVGAAAAAECSTKIGVSLRSGVQLYVILLEIWHRFEEKKVFWEENLVKV